MESVKADEASDKPTTATGEREQCRSRALRQLAALAITLVSVLLCHEDIIALPLRAECMVTSLLAVLAAVAVVRINKHGIWSPSSLLLFAIMIFHFGLTMSFALGLEGGWITQQMVRLWFTSDITQVAIFLTTIGVLGYAIGVHAGKLLFRERRISDDDDEWHSRLLTYAGLAIVSIGAVWWYYIAFRTGFIGASYGYFRAVLRGELGLSTVNHLITWGLLLLAAASPSRLRSWGFGVFGLMAIPSFVIGARGEVLFPVAAALAILGKQKRLMPLPTAAILGVCLLVAVSVVKNVRLSGIGAMESSEIEGTYTEGINELGGTLRCVYATVKWRQRGDELIYGASYWAPFDRGLARIIPGWTRPDILDDDRILGILIARREGSVGFSMMAEAYYNFGVPGVLFIMLAIAVLVEWMTSWPTRPILQAVFGIIIYPLFYTVRNSFVMLPATIAGGLGLLGIVVFVGWLWRCRSR